MSATSFTIPNSYRERIYRQLDDLSRYPLIGVLGETGFNKTGLINSWLNEQGDRCLFINGPDLEGPAGSLPDTIRSFFARDPAPTSWLVINRYHKLADDSPVHSELTAFIEQNPADIRIIINDRVPPALALTRLKAHQLYAQIESADLAYSPEETTEYFRECCDLPLPAAEEEALYAFTCGWPAICTLLAEYMKRNPETKTERILAQPFRTIPELSAYLTEEILRKEPDWLQQFLLQTSLMLQLDPNIIADFLDDADSAGTVNYLAKNRFYTYTDDSGHCQYLSVFRSFLYHKNLQENAAQVADRHCMLAELYHQKQFYIEAFCHAVAGNDYILATSIVQQISSRYNTIQFVNLIDGQLEQISSDLKFSDTTLFLTRCFPEQTLSEFIPLLKELIRFEQQRGSRLKLANLQNRLGVIYFLLGEIGPATELFTASSDLAADMGEDTLLVCDLQLLADCSLFSGDMDRSLNYAKKALFIAETHDLLTMRIHTLEVLTRIALKQQELPKAKSYLEEALALSEDDPFLSIWLCADQSALLLAEGAPADALLPAEKACACIVPGSSGYDTALAYLAMGNVYMHLQEPAKAEECFATACANAVHCKSLLYEILTCRLDLFTARHEVARAAAVKAELTDLCRECHYSQSPWYQQPAPEATPEAEAPMLEIHTMGSFAITYDHKPVTIKRSSSLSLLQFLIVNWRYGANKEVIIDNIFPYEAANQENNFNVALSVLRKSLEPGLRSGKDSRYILRQKHSYMLNKEAIRLDAQELLTVCSRIMAQSDSLDAGQLDLFKSLYGGEFMADFPYEEFLNAERQRISRICLDTMLHIAHYYRKSETPARSIEYYEQILENDPYYEAVYLDYIDLLLSLRTSHKARDIADKMVRFIETELGSPVTDSIEDVFRKNGFKYKKTGR